MSGSTEPSTPASVTATRFSGSTTWAASVTVASAPLTTVPTAMWVGKLAMAEHPPSPAARPDAHAPNRVGHHLQISKHQIRQRCGSCCRAVPVDIWRAQCAGKEGLAIPTGPCHVLVHTQSTSAEKNRCHDFSTACRQAHARRHRFYCRGPGGDGAQVSRLLGDRQRRAVFGRAGEHRQFAHGTGRALCAACVGPACRSAPPVRAPQGRILLRRARRRADRRRRARHLPRGLRRLSGAACLAAAVARHCDQWPCHGHQRRLVVFSRHLGPPPSLSGIGRRRPASADRCCDLGRRARRAWCWRH